MKGCCTWCITWWKADLVLVKQVKSCISVLFSFTHHSPASTIFLSVRASSKTPQAPPWSSQQPPQHWGGRQLVAQLPPWPRPERCTVRVRPGECWGLYTTPGLVRNPPEMVCITGVPNHRVKKVGGPWSIIWGQRCPQFPGSWATFELTESWLTATIVLEKTRPAVLYVSQVPNVTQEMDDRLTGIVLQATFKMTKSKTMYGGHADVLGTPLQKLGRLHLKQDAQAQLQPGTFRNRIWRILKDNDLQTYRRQRITGATTNGCLHFLLEVSRPELCNYGSYL